MTEADIAEKEDAVGLRSGNGGDADGDDETEEPHLGSAGAGGHVD